MQRENQEKRLHNLIASKGWNGDGWASKYESTGVNQIGGLLIQEGTMQMKIWKRERKRRKGVNKWDE